MEEAQNTPKQAISLCHQLEDLSQHDECLILASEKTIRKDIKQTTDICAAIHANTTKGECYFRVAEFSQKKEFCLKSENFQKDCQLHLFSRELFRTKLDDYTQIAIIAEEFDISPTTMEGQTVIYRHLLSLKTPIPIHMCSEYFDPQACERAAQGLYLDRLRFSQSQNKFPCDNLGELDHQNNPNLLVEYQQLAKEICP